MSFSQRICVEGVFDAVSSNTEFSGKTTIGKGPGRRETASAILRDLIDLEEIGITHRPAEVELCSLKILASFLSGLRNLRKSYLLAFYRNIDGILGR